MRTRALLLPALTLLLAGLASAKLLGSSDTQAAAGPSAGTETRVATGDELRRIEDAPLESYRADLLDLAYRAASKFPRYPHIKNRSRAQDQVAATCFELDQPRRALTYIEGIDNWRRGAGYADFAFYCAQHGAVVEVQHYLDLAQELAKEADEEGDQEWRRDRIMAKVARTLAWLGENERAEGIQGELSASEAGRVDEARAMQVEAEAFEAQFEQLSQVLEIGGLDEARNALASCALLFDRFYADGARRKRVEERMKTGWEKLPLQVCFETTLQLAGYALDHADEPTALRLVEEAQAMLDGVEWTPRFLVPLTGRVAEMRFRAGDTERALEQVRAALALFEKERERITDVFRPETLLPLAEAYHAAGDGAATLRTYRRVVDEAVVNPNSRPRVEDLVDACCSMARLGVEPDAALWKRLKEIEGGLGEPW